MLFVEMDDEQLTQKEQDYRANLWVSLLHSANLNANVYNVSFVILFSLIVMFIFYFL